MEVEWKKFERNNKTIALNILYAPHNKKEIGVAYNSKYNRQRKNQVVLLKELRYHIGKLFLCSPQKEAKTQPTF